MSNQLIPLSVAKTVPRYSLAGSFLEGLAAALTTYLHTKGAMAAHREEMGLKEAESRREDLKTRAYVENQAALTERYRHDTSAAAAALEGKVRQLQEANDTLKQLAQIDAAKGSLADQERQVQIARLQLERDRLEAEIQSYQDFIAGGPPGARGGRGAGGSRGGGTSEGSELKDLSKALADLLTAKAQAEATGDDEAATAYGNQARGLAIMLPYVGGSLDVEALDRAGMAAKGFDPRQIDFFYRKKYGMMDPTEREAAAEMLDQESADTADPHGSAIAAYLRLGLPQPPPPPKVKSGSAVPGVRAVTKAVSPYNPQSYLEGLRLIGKLSGLYRETPGAKREPEK